MKRQRALYPLIKPLEKGNIEPQLIGEGALMRAENTLVVEQGRIEKRHGFTALTGTANEKWMGVRKNRPLLFGDTVQVKDNEAIRAGELDEVESRAGLCHMSSEVVRADFNADIMYPEVAVQGDFRVVLYNVRGVGIRIESYDRYSNKLIEAVNTASDEFPGRLVALPDENRIYAIYVDTDIVVTSINTITGDINITSTTMTAWPDVDTTVPGPPIDACAVDDDKISVVYKESGAVKYVIGILTLSGDTVSANSSQQSAAITDTLHYVTCCKWDTGETLLVYAFENTGTTARSVNGVVYDSALSVDEADTPIGTFSGTDIFGQVAAVASVAGSRAEIYWTRMGSDESRPLLWKGNFETGPAVGDEGAKGGDCSLWCKPFVNSAGRVFVGIHFSHGYKSALFPYQGPQQSYFLLEDVGAVGGDPDPWPTPVGKWLVDVAEPVGKYKDPAGGATWPWYRKTQTMVCTPQQTATDEYIVAGIELGENHYDQAWSGKNAIHEIAIDTSPSDVKSHETLSEMIIPGACPKVFDGARISEMNFLTYPDRITLSVGAGNGVWGTTGTVYYRAMYEWYDDDGNRYMSPLSVAVDVAVPATSSNVTVSIPSLKVTHLVDGNAGSYTSPVKVILYRIDAFGSTQYRRLAEIENEPDSDVVTFTDYGFEAAETVVPPLLPDCKNTGHEQEYTLDGYILPNYQPPPFTIGTIWQNRLVVAHSRYPDRLVVLSKEFTEGEGTFFGGTALYLPVDPRGGEITALAGMSDRLAIFKRRAVMMTSGQGWDEAGAGAGFQPPYIINDGVGCKSQLGVIRTPAGTFFESDDCIYLLRPDYSLVPVGRVVRRVTDAMTIVGAALMPDYNQVVWFSSEGTVLVYNWLFNQWMTWTGLAAQSCCTADGVLFYRDDSTSVLYEDPESYLDNGTAIVPTIETGWIAPSELDEIRIWEVRLLGYNLGPSHTLTVKVAWNYAPYWSFTKTFDSADLYAFTPSDQFGSGLSSSYEDGALILRFTPGRRTRCTAIRFQISWAA